MKASFTIWRGPPSPRWPRSLRAAGRRPRPSPRRRRPKTAAVDRVARDAPRPRSAASAASRDRVSRDVDAGDLPVRGSAAPPAPSSAPYAIDDDRVGLAAAPVDPEDGVTSRIGRRRVCALHDLHHDCGRRPRSTVGGLPPASIALRNSCICAVYIGWCSARSPRSAPRAGRSARTPSCRSTSVSASEPLLVRVPPAGFDDAVRPVGPARSAGSRRRPRLYVAVPRPDRRADAVGRTGSPSRNRAVSIACTPMSTAARPRPRASACVNHPLGPQPAWTP